MDADEIEINIDEPDDYITLDEWLERWEAAVEARQSSISQEEATKRYYEKYPEAKEWR